MTTKKQGSGWVKISTPEDLQKALTRMLNKILMSDDPLVHSGRFASLANAWTNSYRLFLEQEEMNAIKERITAMEESQRVVQEQYSKMIKEQSSELRREQYSEFLKDGGGSDILKPKIGIHKKVASHETSE